MIYSALPKSYGGFSITSNSLIAYFFLMNFNLIYKFTVSTQMNRSTCPFCSREVLSVELERHANDHFEDEDLARDVQLANHYQDEDIAIDLAQHIALYSSTPSHVLVDIPMQPQSDFLRVPESISSTSSEATTYGGGSTTDENIRCLVGLQVRDANLEVNHGFIALLKSCLECDAGKSTSILSGHVDHFQSIEFEDVGWGCGWRNIQMLSSHLLVQRKEAREVLFGGGGFVPDIPSLQRWLEIAWEKGFDTAGSNDFDQKIYGKRNWIGTTECAALFRSFGLRAQIVDFCSSSRDHEAGDHGSSVGKRKSTQVIGPMDRYLNRPGTDVHSSNNCTDKYLGICPEMVKGHQLLANWVWSYFSDNTLSKSRCNRVVITEKAPLYFQHDGHSRTIVGIQSKSLPNGMQQYNLLILDPGHKTKVLESCLSKKVGWQRLIKRGVDTLKKPDYQLCYVDPGIVTGEEMEKLKTLDSTRFDV